MAGKTKAGEVNSRGNNALIVVRIDAYKVALEFKGILA